MQPILAESAPHGGRAVAFAVVLALFASFAFLAFTPDYSRGNYRGHHYQKSRFGKCVRMKHVHSKYVHPASPRVTAQH